MHFYNSHIKKWGLATTSLQSTYKNMMSAGNNLDTHAQVFVGNDKLLLPTMISFAHCTCALHATPITCMSFSHCVVVGLFVAPTNSSPVAHPRVNTTRTAPRSPTITWDSCPN